jgi:uncharacterized protein YbjT (DUF2867 family)
MSQRILVTGAPGNVGTEVVIALKQMNADFRVAAFNAERAKQVLGDDIDIVHFDFLNSATYERTFKGIERMFLVRPPQLANVEKEIAPAIHAAIDAGVKHIVFLSLQGVENNRIVPHYKIEQLLRDSQATYTFLRASFFMQNLSTTHQKEIREADEIRIPVGNARTSFIDTRDIASVAAQILTASGDENAIYTLTGAEALTYAEVADIISDVLGRRIRYTNPFILTFIRQQLAEGHRLSYVLVLAALYTITRFGNAKAVTPDVQHLLNREPISFRQFVEDYGHCWS